MSATSDIRTVPGPIAWLSLAATPTFAVMALVATADAPPVALCGPATRFLPVDGMIAMWGLMSLFHLPPWFQLAAGHGPIEGCGPGASMR